MIKKYLIIAVFGLLVLISPALAQDKPVRLYFFHGQGCPHCAAEEKFLPALKSRYPELQVLPYEVWYSTENQQLMQKVAQKFNATITGVPFTVVGDQYVMGFSDTTGEQIQSLVDNCTKNGCADPAGQVLGLPDPNTTSTPGMLNDNSNTAPTIEKKVGLADFLLLGGGIVVLIIGFVLIIRQNKAAKK